mmetsp:Transcript_5527/g.13708  ORF Transcript_5527/g.13708 Transcript_5527/m.13708 type:complete len:433 (-) Transcript_5527:1215-2513(-)
MAARPAAGPPTMASAFLAATTASWALASTEDMRLLRSAIMASCAARLDAACMVAPSRAASSGVRPVAASAVLTPARRSLKPPSTSASREAISAMATTCALRSPPTRMAPPLPPGSARTLASATRPCWLPWPPLRLATSASSAAFLPYSSFTCRCSSRTAASRPLAAELQFSPAASREASLGAMATARCIPSCAMVSACSALLALSASPSSQFFSRALYPMVAFSSESSRGCDAAICVSSALASSPPGCIMRAISGTTLLPTLPASATCTSWSRFSLSALTRPSTVATLAATSAAPCSSTASRCSHAVTRASSDGSVFTAALATFFMSSFISPLNLSMTGVFSSCRVLSRAAMRAARAASMLALPDPTTSSAIRPPLFTCALSASFSLFTASSCSSKAPTLPTTSTTHCGASGGSATGLPRPCPYRVGALVLG